MVGVVPVWASSAWGSVSRWDRCHGGERVSMEVAHPFLSPQPEATLTCSPDLTGRAQLEWGGAGKGSSLHSGRSSTLDVGAPPSTGLACRAQHAHQLTAVSLTLASADEPNPLRECWGC